MAWWSLLERRFETLIGPHAVVDLAHAVTARPVLTVGGSQLTGKSTLGKRLASVLNGRYLSAGQIFRTEATRRHMSLGELSARALEDERIDVGIEHTLCSHIVRGCSDCKGPLVLEGRQPAVMAAYVCKRFGKQECLSVFLHCSVREQALRFIRRELGDLHHTYSTDQLAGETAFHAAEGQLPDGEFRSLRELLPALHTLQLDGSATDRDRVVTFFADIAQRDEDDTQRFLELYGLNEQQGFTNPEWYDYCIDTTPNTSTDTFQQATATLRASFAQWTGLQWATQSRDRVPWTVPSEHEDNP